MKRSGEQFNMNKRDKRFPCQWCNTSNAKRATDASWTFANLLRNVISRQYFVFVAPLLKFFSFYLCVCFSVCRKMYLLVRFSSRDLPLFLLLSSHLRISSLFCGSIIKWWCYREDIGSWDRRISGWSRWYLWEITASCNSCTAFFWTYTCNVWHGK